MSILKEQYEFYKSIKRDDYYFCLHRIYHLFIDAIDNLIDYYCHNDDYYHHKKMYIYWKEIRKSLYEEKRKYEKKVSQQEYEEYVEFLNKMVDIAKDTKRYINKEIKMVAELHAVWLKALKKTCDYIIKFQDNIHHYICDEMFTSIFNGEKVYVYIDNYDANPYTDAQYMSVFERATYEAEESVEYLHCSVVSEKMLEYDELMFGEIRNASDKESDFRPYINYRPYFIEFIIPVDKNGKAKGQFKNNNDELKQITSENGWFEAYFVAKGHERSIKNETYVEGGMLTFASPANYISGKLVFLRPVFGRVGKSSKEDIEDVYNIINERTNDEINRLIKEHVSICSAYVYNIEHGNFITLNDDNDNTKILYDIGLPYTFPISKSFDKIKKDFALAYKIMKKVKPEMIIISHWDTDHYIGAYCNNQNIFDIPWIVTECNPRGQINAKRIMAYLYCQKNLFLYKGNSADTCNAFAEYCDQTIKFQLYKGSKISSPITPINCKGIAVRIEINDVKTLMCGDIPYDCLPNNIIAQNNYKYVVIPHHASSMSKKSYKALNSINSITYPIICVNNKESLGKTGIDVENGEHCKIIKTKSNNNLYFTDDNSRKICAYICDLTGKNQIDTK